MVRIFIVALILALSAFVLEPLVGVDLWVLFLGSVLVFAACDLTWWAAPLIWRWLTRRKPTIGDDWHQIVATDAGLAPLTSNPFASLSQPGRVIMGRDVGLPDTATLGQIVEAMGRAPIQAKPVPAAQPAPHLPLRGPNGRFIKAAQS